MEKDAQKVDRRLKFDLRQLPDLEYLPPAPRADFTDEALHNLLQAPVQTVKSRLADEIRAQHFK